MLEASRKSVILAAMKLLFLKREMASVQQVQFRLRQVAQESPGTRLREERIVLAPDDQRLWLMLAKVGWRPSSAVWQPRFLA